MDLPGLDHTITQSNRPEFPILQLIKINLKSFSPPSLLLSIDLLMNKNSDESFMTPSLALYEDFACHFRSKIDLIRSSLFVHQHTPLKSSESLFVPEETLESLVLGDAKTLGRVFSQVNPTTCLLDPFPTSLLKNLYRFFEAKLLSVGTRPLHTGGEAPHEEEQHKSKQL